MRTGTEKITKTSPPSDKDLRRLLLKFVLSESEDSRLAFDAWERHVVFDDSSFQSFKLLSAVYPKLLEHNISSRLFLRIKGAYRRTWTENQLLLAHIGDLFADLHAHGIDFMIADGAFRLTEIYNDVGIFSLQDFLVVAPIRERNELCRRLLENSWEICFDSAARTHCKKDRASGINIRWTDNKAFDDRSNEADSIPIGNKLHPIVRTEDQILDFCENRFMIQGDEESDWQLIAGSLFNSGSIDGSRLIDLAERRYLTSELANMIDALKADLDLRVPAELSTKLRSTRRPGRIALVAERLRKLRQDYRIHLANETRNGSKAGFVEFMERRWEADSYRDLIKQGIRSCVRLMQAR